jgi:hypothetical protein
MRHATWWCASRRWIVVLGLSVFVWMGTSSCSAPPTPEMTFERGPLPYHVGLFVDVAKLGFDAGAKPAATDGQLDKAPEPDSPRGGSDGNGGGADASASTPPPAEAGRAAPPVRVHYTLNAAEMAGSLARSLTDSTGAVSLARVLPAGDRVEAFRVAREQNVDVLLALGFETRPEYDEHHYSPAWGTLEVACWLFGGIPAWFVPTVGYATDARLKIEVVDLCQRKVRDWKPGATADAPPFDWKTRLDSSDQSTSLWDRAHPFDRPLFYLLTLVVPPMIFNPGDPERLSTELTGDVMSDLGSKLGRALRAKLLEGESKAPLSIAFISPDPRDGLKGESMSLRLAVASRGEGRISRLEVHRFAPKAMKHRWFMTPEQVDKLARSLEALPPEGGYVSFDVPHQFPIEPGENVIKVWILRDDGEQVTRTMVFRRR